MSSRFPVVAIPVVAIKPLPVLAAMLSAALLSGCGDDRAEDTRVDRAVVVKVAGARTDGNGNLFLFDNDLWQRPAVALKHTLLKADESTNCDLIYNEHATELAADKDSTCFVSGGCFVSTGVSQYNSVLGSFSVVFINNSTQLTQEMSIDGVGVNIIIRNEAGAEVFNFTRDNRDYLDWLNEANSLFTEDIDNKCKDGIDGRSDATTLPGVALLGTPGRPFDFKFTPANSEDLRLRFTWDGKDASGNDVPKGIYTANFEITVTDKTTGQAWEDPAPLTFTIAD